MLDCDSKFQIVCGFALGLRALFYFVLFVFCFWCAQCDKKEIMQFRPICL